MSEKELQSEVRLLAIEYMVTNLYNILYRIVGADKEVIATAMASFREKMRTEVFPGLDAEQSALASGEIEDAVGRFLQMIEEMTGVARKPDP